MIPNAKTRAFVAPPSRGISLEVPLLLPSGASHNHISGAALGLVGSYPSINSMFWYEVAILNFGLVSLSTSEAIDDRLVYPRIDVGLSPDTELESRRYLVPDLFEEPLYTAKAFELSKQGALNRYSLETQMAKLERTRPTSILNFVPADGDLTDSTTAFSEYLAKRAAEFKYLQPPAFYHQLRIRLPAGQQRLYLPLVHVVPDKQNPASLRDEILDFLGPFEDYVLRCTWEDVLELVEPWWWYTYNGQPANPEVTLTDYDIEGDWAEGNGLRPEWNQATVTHKAWETSLVPSTVMEPGSIRLYWGSVDWQNTAPIALNRKALIDTGATANPAVLGNWANWNLQSETVLPPTTSNISVLVKCAGYHMDSGSPGGITGPHGVTFRDQPTVSGAQAGNVLTPDAQGYVTNSLPMDGQQHLLCSINMQLGVGPNLWMNVLGRWEGSTRSIVISVQAQLSANDFVGATHYALFALEMEGEADLWQASDTVYTGRFGYSVADFTAVDGLEAAQAEGVFTAPQINIEKYNFGGSDPLTVVQQIAQARVINHFAPKRILEFNLAPPYKLGPGHLNRHILLPDGRHGVLTSIQHNENHTPYTTASRQVRVEIIESLGISPVIDPGGSSGGSGSSSGGSGSSSGGGGGGGTTNPPVSGTIEYTLEADNSAFPNPEQGYIQGKQVGLNNSGGLTAFDFAALANGTASGLGGNHQHRVIKAYVKIPRDAPISAAQMSHLDALAAHCRLVGVKLVVRFYYAWTGEADATEARIDQQLTEQIGPWLTANKDIVIVHQAGFIGEYGEWHDSFNNLLGITTKNRILGKILAATPIGIRVAVRHLQDITDYLGSTTLPTFAEILAGRLMVYDDAYVANWHDAGTYYWQGGTTVVASQRNYMAGYSAGAGLITEMAPDIAWDGTPDPWGRRSGPGFLTENARMHLLMIASDAGPSDIGPTQWGAMGIQNEMDTKVGARLRGTKAFLPGAIARGASQAALCQFDLVNEGWSNMLNSRPVFGFLQQGSTVYDFPINIDSRLWTPGNTHSAPFGVTLPANAPAGTYSVGLWLPDIATGLRGNSRFSFRMANTGWDATTGRNNLAAVEVI